MCANTGGTGVCVYASIVAGEEESEARSSRFVALLPTSGCAREKEGAVGARGHTRGAAAESWNSGGRTIHGRRALWRRDDARCRRWGWDFFFFFVYWGDKKREILCRWKEAVLRIYIVEEAWWRVFFRGYLKVCIVVWLWVDECDISVVYWFWLKLIENCNMIVG